MRTQDVIDDEATTQYGKERRKLRHNGYPFFSRRRVVHSFGISFLPFFYFLIYVKREACFSVEGYCMSCLMSWTDDIIL